LDLDPRIQGFEEVSKVFYEVAPVRRVDHEGNVASALRAPLEKKECA
jgi:hypothetical protein